MNELEFYRVLQANRRIPTVAQLTDDFQIEGHTGPHICLVFQPMGPHVTSFRMTSPTEALKPYIVKKIISDVAKALAGLHRNGIIHTGAICIQFKFQDAEDP